MRHSGSRTLHFEYWPQASSWTEQAVTVSGPSTAWMMSATEIDGRRPGQAVAAARPLVRRQQAAPGQALQDLGHQLDGNVVVLGDFRARCADEPTPGARSARRGASSPSARSRSSWKASARSAYLTASAVGRPRKAGPPSILRLARIDLVGPGQNPALEVDRLREPVLLEERHRLGAAAADLAVDDQVARRIELGVALLQLTERDQRGPLDARDLRLERLADVEDLQARVLVASTPSAPWRSSRARRPGRRWWRATCRCGGASMATPTTRPPACRRTARSRSAR